MNCMYCGAELYPGEQVCRVCGTVVDWSQMQSWNQTYTQPDMKQEQGLQNQQAYGQQGWQQNPPAYGQQMQWQQNPQPYGQPDGRRKRKKKKLWIPIVILMTAVAAVAVWFIFFSGNLTRFKAQKTIENYAEKIEQKDVKGVLFATLPKDLLRRVFNQYEYELGGSYDDFMDEIDDYLEDDDVSEVLDAAEIKFSHIKVTDVTPFTMEGYIDYLDELLDSMAGEYEIEDLSAEELLCELIGEDMSADQMEAKLKAALGIYDIDLEDAYIVDLSFHLSLEAEIYGETYSENCDSDELGMNRVIIYKYEDEWYVLPPVIETGAMAPAMIKYVGNSRKSNDVSSAETIKTAVNTTLCNEYFYEEMTTEHANEWIMLTDDGLSVLSNDMEEYLRDNIGDIPDIKYTNNGANCFAFLVDDYGTVYVSIVGEDGEMWEIVPELDEEYQ